MPKTIDKSNLRERHDKYAPLWAGALVVLCGTGLATVWLDHGDFWKGYLLDMTGPAWNYILFRGLFTSYGKNAWTDFFTPVRTLLILIAASYGIETAQYLNLYEATFDPWDFLAYVSILFPLFLIDIWLRAGSEYGKS